MDSSTETTSNEFTALAESGVYNELFESMVFYGPDKFSAFEIRDDRIRMKALETRQGREAFKEWAEALIKIEEFRKNRATKVEYARTKYKRPDIAARWDPEILLTTARIFGNLDMFGAFVNFPCLPKKIRFRIWRYTTMPRRFLEVFILGYDGISISRDKWDNDRLLHIRRACKEADTAILAKYQKFWVQELFPLATPNFKTILFSFKADILHLTSFGALQVALGKSASSLIKNVRNIGFLFDHFGYLIKYYPDELVNMLVKLKSVETIVLQWRERIWSEEIFNPDTNELEPVTYKYGKLLATEHIKRTEAMNSTYDWFDLSEKPRTEYQAKIEQGFRWYIETQPRLYHLRGIRIWFLYPRTEHDVRLLRPRSEMGSSN